MAQCEFKTERGQFKSGRQLAGELFHESIRVYLLNNAPIPPDLPGQLGIPRREVTDVVIYERKKLQNQILKSTPSAR